MSGTVKPLAQSQADLLPATTGLASWVSPFVDCTYCHQISFTIAWTAVAATAGTLTIEGTDDPTQANSLYSHSYAYAQVAADFTAGTNVVPLTITTTHGTYPTVSTSAANAMVILENPPRFVRVKYTRSAGGGAAQFTVLASARAT